jgi:hypothetical protein
VPYHILVNDANTGKDAILCHAATREDARQAVNDLAVERPDLRFAILADEEPDRD